MLLTTWLCICFAGLCGFVYADKNEENAMEEQQMDNFAEWMSTALEKANHEQPHFLERFHMDDTSKRGEDNAKEAPGFIGMRGRRKTPEMHEDSFTSKLQQNANFPPGFVAVRGKKETGSTGRKIIPPGFIGVRGRRNQDTNQEVEIPPGFISPRGKKQTDITLPGFVAPHSKRDIVPGFIASRGKKHSIVPRSIGLRGGKDGLVALINSYRNVEERNVPFYLARNKDLYDVMNYSQDDNEENEFELVLPEMESKQVIKEIDLGKFYTDCVAGNHYFCRRFVAIKG